MTRVFTGLHAVNTAPVRAVVTVGVFDGVHVAHQHLVRTAVRRARDIDGTSVVVTFDPDPQIVLEPDIATPALMPLSERLACLGALGVDRIWVIRFTPGFASMSAEQFIRRILIKRLHACALVVGERFMFGKDRRGGIDVLKTLGPPNGMRIVAVNEVRRGGASVSSSRIRRLIREGKPVQAARLLTRPPALYGVVVRGAGRGRQLGFPTANIRLMPQVLPPGGVYAVLVRRLDRPIRSQWCGVMNFGVRPTFGPGPLVCEVHLLNFSGTLRRQSVAVALLARLRAERCFPSPTALRRQIQHDVVRARRLFLGR